MQPLHEYYDESQCSSHTVVDKFAHNIYQVSSLLVYNTMLQMAPISTNPEVKVKDFTDLEMARDIENYLSNMKSKPGYDYPRN